MSVDRVLDIVFLVLFLSLLIVLPWHLFRKQRKMGDVLFHLPAPRSHKVSLGIFLALGMAVVLFHIVSMINGGWQSSLRLWPLLAWAFPVFSMSSVKRFEIRAEGIISQGRLTKWNDLSGFQWKEEGDYKFGLGEEAYILGLNKVGDRFLWWLEWEKFQPRQRDRVDKLLSEYLPNASRL